MRAIGLRREPRFSPGRVKDDAAILDAVAQWLVGRGARVDVLESEPLPAGLAAKLEAVDVIFSMAAGDESLDAVAASGRPAVNASAALRACRRGALYPALDRAGVSQPAWCSSVTGELAALGERPWRKPVAAHAQSAGDVARVDPRAPASDEMLQAHVEGAHFKFYGTRGGFFRSYGLAASLVAAARDEAEAAAASIDLEVYGGDGVVTAAGRVVLIDLNDWPSFAPCRAAAAAAIGELVWRRGRGERR